MIQGRGWVAVSALLVSSVGLMAQGPRGFGGGFGGGMGKVVTGEAYTAAATSTSIEKLANGTTITHSSTIAEARDGEGRTVKTVTSTGPGGKAETHTTVTDPVAHTVTEWSSGSTTATQFQLPTPPPGGGRGQGQGPGSSGPGGRVRPEVTTTTLTPKSIAGVTADGVKTTVTVPAGAEGNDKPLVSTREVWTSPELKIVLLETSESPRDGFHKLEVTTLTQGTPDPTLFQVPQGYTVKVQTRHRGF